MEARILLVEDSPVLQRVAMLQLRSCANFTLDVASNGAQAIALVMLHSYALILMDLHLPEVDGFEASRRIRQLENGKTVPIVAVTASSDERECRQAGLDDYVAKPADYRNVVERWLPDLSKEAV